MNKPGLYSEDEVRMLHEMLDTEVEARRHLERARAVDQETIHMLKDQLTEAQAELDNVGEVCAEAQGLLHERDWQLADTKDRLAEAEAENERLYRLVPAVELSDIDDA